MKNKKAKTVLGASILAAALTAQAHSAPVKSKKMESKISHEVRASENGKLLNPAAKEVFIKDLSKKREAMANGSKTEIVAK